MNWTPIFATMSSVLTTMYMQQNHPFYDSDEKLKCDIVTKLCLMAKKFREIGKPLYFVVDEEGDEFISCGMPWRTCTGSWDNDDHHVMALTSGFIKRYFDLNLSWASEPYEIL